MKGNQSDDTLLLGLSYILVVVFLLAVVENRQPSGGQFSDSSAKAEL